MGNTIMQETALDITTFHMRYFGCYLGDHYNELIKARINYHARSISY